jgi:hypothetical protein
MPSLLYGGILECDHDSRQNKGDTKTIISQPMPGRSFEAKIAQDVSVKRNVVLRRNQSV